MFNLREENRLFERKYIEPYDSKTYLSFKLDGKDYKFSFLDVSPAGVGMLVENHLEDVLKKLHNGLILAAEYGTPYATISTKFEVIHITKILRGPFKGHHQVGLHLVSD